jgi:hypothetical protein
MQCFFLFIRFFMLLFVILIQNIYRSRRFGGASVGTAPPNRGCCAGAPPNEGAGAYLEAAGGDALTV